MRTKWRRVVSLGAGIALVGTTAFLAAGCGGGGGESKTTTGTTTGSQSSLPQSIGKGEGALNLIEWPYYSDPSFAKTFEEQTGCKIKRKDAGSSNQMVALMRTGGGGGGGQYDLVSASGDASLRLIAGGDVVPVNVELIPSWKDFIPVFKSPPHNTVDGVHYGVSLQWGPNTLMFNTKESNQRRRTGRSSTTRKYKGQITVPNNPIQIADAALYLSKTESESKITDPYELTQEQFDATINLLKEQKPLVKTYWNYASDEIQAFAQGDVSVGASWPYQTLQLQAKGLPIRRSSRSRESPAGRTRGCLREAGSASELRVHVDEVREHAEGAGAAGPRLRRDSRQPEGLPVHGQDPGRFVRELPPGQAAALLLDDQVLEDAGRGLRQRRQRLQGLQRVAESVDRGNGVIGRHHG